MEKKMKTARQLVETAATGVVSVAPDDPVMAVLRAMADHGVGAVLVLDGAKLAGTITAHDYAVKVELRGRTAKDTLAREIMTGEVICIAADARVDQCMSVMHNKGVDHLPVMEQGQLIGMLAMRDVLEEVVAEDEHLIRDLEHERLESDGNTGGSY